MKQEGQSATAGIPVLQGREDVKDDHIVYSIVLVGLALADAGTTLGLGNLPIIRRNPYLK
ncbi:hypothetical protein [Nonomuraea sp. B5E05]|uniref:hypothetical protein n=1 Tax=Nonomuraea sp. B5E05 TaxID=3153569 RepID=UPI003260F3CC